MLISTITESVERFVRDLPQLGTTVMENRRYMVYPAAALIGYVVLKNPVEDRLHWFFSYIYMNHFLEPINENLKSFREEMRKELSKQKSRDPRPHNDDTLRILEIGAGPGTSLDYYPRSSRVIVVEPNPYFLVMLTKKQESTPNLVKVIKGFAEDLRDIKDESIDAVVSTLVLCSVNDLDKSISEIKRVLVKGGRFYFLEHQVCQLTWTRYLVQNLLTPIWSIIMDGCKLNRHIHKRIEAHGFDISHAKEELDQAPTYFFLKSKTSGYAIKV